MDNCWAKLHVFFRVYPSTTLSMTRLEKLIVLHCKKKLFLQRSVKFVIFADYNDYCDDMCFKSVNPFSFSYLVDFHNIKFLSFINFFLCKSLKKYL